jgi:peptidyl-prolyl cis-trans isomerase C
MKVTGRAKKAILLSLSISLTCALVACNDGTAPVTTQIAAKFGSNEVTLYEVDRAAARLPTVAQTDLPAKRKRVLDDLVNQRLMADEAIRRKLDRTPDAVSDVELCKVSTLQNAYLKSIAGEAIGDTLSVQRDARNYYESHPLLFSARRVYSMREIAFSDHVGVDATQAKTMPFADLMALLEQRGIGYKTTFGAVAAEQLPPEVLEEMDSLHDGERKVLSLSGNLLVLMRITGNSVPMEEQAAEPAIIQYLEHVSVDAHIHTQIASLRSRSDVKYMNEFTESGTVPGALSIQGEGTSGGNASASVAVKH